MSKLLVSGGLQHDRLAYLENLIARNQGHFYENGKALKEIRDNRLYKQTLYKTFEAYTRARWDMGRAQAYRLIKSSTVIRNLSPIGDILPGNESQVRPLVQLDLLEQRKVWKGFINSGMEITAHNINKFIVSCKTTDKSKPVDLTDQISQEYMTAVLGMLKQVSVAQNDHWQKTSRQAGLLWSRVIREKILKDPDNG